MCISVCDDMRICVACAFILISPSIAAWVSRSFEYCVYVCIYDCMRVCMYVRAYVCVYVFRRSYVNVVNKCVSLCAPIFFFFVLIGFILFFDIFLLVYELCINANALVCAPDSVGHFDCKCVRLLMNTVTCVCHFYCALDY